MAASIHIDSFSNGEEVVIELFAKNADGSGDVIDSPATQEIVFVISNTPDGDPLIEASNTSGHVTLTDEDLGKFTIVLDPETDLQNLVSKKPYYYAAWSVLDSVSKLQAKGKFTIQKAVQKS